ncbi:MAG: hypothetical protein WCA78_14000 [Rhizomicrobium sp.]
MKRLALPKRGTIANTVLNSLLAKMSNQRVLAEVRERHPRSKTTLDCIAWYRNKFAVHLDMPSSYEAERLICKSGVKLRLVA